MSARQAGRFGRANLFKEGAIAHHEEEGEEDVESKNKSLNIGKTKR
jgi:hypothetical protein